jgi:hypothetical protein
MGTSFDHYGLAQVDTIYLGCFLGSDLFGVFQDSKFLFLTKLLVAHDTSSSGLSRESVTLIQTILSDFFLPETVRMF